MGDMEEMYPHGFIEDEAELLQVLEAWIENLEAIAGEYRN